MLTPTPRPATRGSRRWYLLLTEGACTHPLLSETAGACQPPQPWDDPSKPLKGKRESVTSLVVADGSSLAVLRRGEDASRRGAGIATELGVRRDTEGFSAAPTCPYFLRDRRPPAPTQTHKTRITGYREGAPGARTSPGPRHPAGPPVDHRHPKHASFPQA